MDKNETIRFLKNDHRKLEIVINRLDEDQLLQHSVLGPWTVKDIIAHISAWNLELAKAIDGVLDNQKPWYVKKTEDEFNKREIEKRKGFSLNQIQEEWHESFYALIEKIKRLSEPQWEHESGLFWPSGGSLTILSLFGYRYRGEGHEGGHAKQIVSYFEMLPKGS